MTSFIYSVDIKGDKEFIDAIKSAPIAVQESLKTATTFLRTLVVQKTPWLTGVSAGAWSSVEPTDGGYSFGNPLAHMFNLEAGWDKVKNPKSTVMGEGGRYYSKKAPGGIIKPLLDSPEIINQVVKLFLDGVIRRMNV